MRKFTILIVAILMFVLHGAAQNRTVTGKVTNDAGSPVANATVAVKGTSLGTVTNAEGAFSISVPSTAKALTISSLSFDSQEVNLGSQSQLTISLKPASSNLDEVLVVAYGTVKRATATGSVGQINAKDIETRAVTNPLNAVEGAIAGVTVTSSSGQPGSSNAIRVRGFGSINATSDPLFVVDGVPYIGGATGSANTGGSANINPDDIESLTVLKDAASTALYGSRAANGVVIITTKRGKKGRNSISVRALQGVSGRGLQEYDRVDAYQYYPLMWETYRNSLVYPISGPAISLDSANRVASGLTGRTSIYGLLNYNPFRVPNNAIVGTDGKLNPNANTLLYGDDLDWNKELLRTGTRSDYSVNFNGGADKSDYFVSLGYLDDKGYTIRSDLKRYTARINVNIQPKTWLKTGLNISGNYSNSNIASDDGSTNFVNPFFFSRNIGPIYPVYVHNMTTGEYVLDANGKRIWDLGNLGSSGLGINNRSSGGFAGRHTLAETTLNEQFFRRTVASARQYTDILFLKNFKFTNNVAVDFQTQYNGSYENTLVGDGAPAGRADREFGSNTVVTLSQLLNFNKKIGDHSIDVLAGHETYNQTLQGQRGFRQGQSLTGNTELGNFTTINAATSYTDRYRIESFLSRASYDFRGKYFISGSLRADGNSRFSRQSRWGTFWSVGGGWNINKEEFFKASWVDLLKIRSSYGVVGVADGIGYYAYQSLYAFNNNANEPGISQIQTSFQNNDLTWEVNKQFDIGTDFSFFKGRLSGTLEYYNRISEKLLFAVPQPLSSGLLSVTRNTANLFNKGVELQLSGDVVRTRDLKFNITLNISTVKNQITAMPPNVTEFITTTGNKKYAVGASIYDFWLRSYYGVDPADGAVLYVPTSNATVTGRRVITNKSGGQDTVNTLVSNGKFDYQGSAIPDYYGSVSPSVSYKGLTLSALFTFQKGGVTYDALYQGLMSASTYGGALHTDILNRWQKAGDITNVPRMDNGRNVDFNATSSRWLVDASYFNIRTVTLSYVLPAAIAKKLTLTNTQFFLTAENLAFYSKRKGMNNQQAFGGVTSNAYPPARILTAGVTLNL